MDWHDLSTAQGQVVDGHRLGEVLGPRRMRTLRLHDRRPGCFWLLQLDDDLRTALQAGLVGVPDRSVLPILGSGVLDSTHGYLLTPEVPASTLDDLLEDGPVEPSRVVRILRELALAYRALHAAEVWLLDLRPADVLVNAGWEDGVRIPPHPALLGKAVGRTMGGYCAPDVVFEDVDARADQFTLGVIGFELLTGTTPHNPEAPPGERTMLPPDPLQGVPESLTVVIHTLLRDERTQRYPDMDAVIQALGVLDAARDEPTYGHFTPVMPERRAERPVYIGDATPVQEDDEDAPDTDSILSFLLLLVGAWAVTMALSVAVFWMW